MDSRERRLNQLVNDHLDFVKRMLRRQGFCEDELDEITQRALIVVAARLDDIRIGAERGFLLSSARRLASRSRRRAARAREQESLENELVSPLESPEDLAHRKTARETFDRLLEELPEDLRVVFKLYEVEQLRMPEIAAYLDAPLGTVASRLRRARKAFGAGLQRTQAAAFTKRRRAYLRAVGVSMLEESDNPIPRSPSANIDHSQPRE